MTDRDEQLAVARKLIADDEAERASRDLWLDEFETDIVEVIRADPWPMSVIVQRYQRNQRTGERRHVDAREYRWRDPVTNPDFTAAPPEPSSLSGPLVRPE